MRRLVLIKLAGWILAILLCGLVLVPLMERVPSAYVDVFARKIAFALYSREAVRRYEVIFTALVVGFALQEFLHRWKMGGRVLRAARRRHQLSPKVALYIALAVAISAAPVGHYSTELLIQLLGMPSA